MTDEGPTNPPAPPATTPTTQSATARQAARIPARLALASAARLVTQSVGREAAARRLMAAAPSHGIDLTLAWGTLEEHPAHQQDRVRQVCLGVPGAGRTVMLFVSEPPPAGDPGGPATGRAERASAVASACRHFREHPVSPAHPGMAPVPPALARLAQGLPDPREYWAVEAFQDAGFLCVGHLSYLRRALHRRVEQPADQDWPAGIEVVLISTLADHAERERLLVEALDASYHDTLDCPELCGLRETGDVLASHRATGVFDPALWWLVLSNHQARGCMLLNRCPDSRSVELVYLGLSPELRGKGIARRLLALGAARAALPEADEMTCAVDQRNTPALSLYRRAGFSAFAQRIALVFPL